MHVRRAWASILGTRGCGSPRSPGKARLSSEMTCRVDFRGGNTDRHTEDPAHTPTCTDAHALGCSTQTHTGMWHTKCHTHTRTCAQRTLVCALTRNACERVLTHVQEPAPSVFCPFPIFMRVACVYMAFDGCHMCHVLPTVACIRFPPVTHVPYSPHPRYPDPPISCPSWVLCSPHNPVVGVSPAGSVTWGMSPSVLPEHRPHPTTPAADGLRPHVLGLRLRLRPVSKVRCSLFLA